MRPPIGLAPPAPPTPLAPLAPYSNTQRAGYDTRAPWPPVAPALKPARPPAPEAVYAHAFFAVGAPGGEGTYLDALGARAVPPPFGPLHERPPTKPRPGYTVEAVLGPDAGALYWPSAAERADLQQFSSAWATPWELAPGEDVACEYTIEPPAAPADAVAATEASYSC